MYTGSSRILFTLIMTFQLKSSINLNAYINKMETKYMLTVFIHVYYNIFDIQEGLKYVEPEKE